MKNLNRFDWPVEELEKVPLGFTVLFVKDLSAGVMDLPEYTVSSTGIIKIPSLGDTKMISRIELDLRETNE
ncbi:hypothetical protein N9W89_11240 [Hellea sp.]|nr:hypothetical protein [Hellea sp.]